MGPFLAANSVPADIEPSRPIASLRVIMVSGSR
jgi:hypothetical protein